MLNEQKLFLKCLSNHIHHEKTWLGDSVNWSELSKIAQSQEIGGIVYFQCKDYLEAEILKESFASNAYFAINRDILNKKIILAFNQNQIQFILLKGAAVSSLYPIPALRTMGDTDILVRRNDKEKAHAILIEIGFTNLGKYENEWLYSKDGFEIELHHSFCYENSLIPTDKIRQYTGGIWEYVRQLDRTSQYCLDWDNHLVFLLIHIRQHFLGRGVGFRQFLDLAVVSENVNISWEKVQKILEETEMIQFGRTCFALCNQWFNTHIPITRELPNIFIEEATKQTFESGVFGFDNKKEQYSYYFLQVLGQSPKKRFFAVLAMFFPSYKELCGDPQYRFFNGKPYMLPIIWIYRGVRSIKRGNAKTTIQTALAPYTNKTAVMERDKYLRQFGI